MIINIDLIFLNDNESICLIYDSHNRIYNMIFLNRLNWAVENGIRASLQIENIEIMVAEDYNNIRIDLGIYNNEYISDEDFSDFEQNQVREWENTSEPIDAIPIRWYNDNHLEDTEDWYSD